MPPTHRSRDTAHAQWLQTHCQWYLREMSELITQERIAVGSSYLLEMLTTCMTTCVFPCMTTDQGQEVKGNGRSYQLQTWWKLSSRGEKHV